MSKPEFVHTTYIETTPEKLWEALTDGDFTERYWFGHRVASDWEIGSPYRFTKPGADEQCAATGQASSTISGKVLVFDPPKRLAYSWEIVASTHGRNGTRGISRRTTRGNMAADDP